MPKTHPTSKTSNTSKTCSPLDEPTYTVFEGQKIIFQGPLDEIIPKIKHRIGKASHTEAIIFSDSTGKVMDFNFQGGEAEVAKRLQVFGRSQEARSSEALEPAVPGRPKLGVVSREISLLPRHWEWLACQPQGASATLRMLVDEAKKKPLSNSGLIKQAQEKTYRFVSVMAGDLEGYEEALRSLYKKEEHSFLKFIASWPSDIRKHTLRLAEIVFKETAFKEASER